MILSTLKSTLAILLIAVHITSCSDISQPSDQHVEGLIGKQSMVVSAHPIASEVGLEILRSGGNAFDAAIAVQYALAVVYPMAGNIGGGGFMVYRKSDGECGALDFRETAPMNASRDMFLDESGAVEEGRSKFGHLAAGVPGSVAGMDEVFKKFGSMPFNRLIDPAIHLALNGFPLTKMGAEAINESKDDFIKANTSKPFLARDQQWQPGDTIKYVDLAKTLSLIRDNGKAGFYEGEIADLIVQEMKAGNGIITKEDLKNYAAVWREPIKTKYKNYNVISMPPSSSGGIALTQLMKGSEAFDFHGMPYNSPACIHLMTELMRRTYADRATHLGDTDYYDVPVDMLIDSAYISRRMSNIHLDKATPSAEIKEGKVDRIESYQTTHFSITDKWGNAVSITTTLNGYFGSCVMVDGAGFFLNNEMDDFSVKPGVPNQFGLLGGEANAIAPGKRMLSSMTPTIVEKDGKLHMVLGTPGGSTIITNVYQVFMNVAEHGMTMQEAVNAKKIHAQWLPDIITLEENAADSLTRQTLTAMGHELNIIPQIGRFEAIMVKPDGSYEGAADCTRPGDCTARGE